MKFNCGLSSEEEYNLAHEEKTRQNSEEQPWVRVFAWLPTRVATKDCRWLEFIEMRGSEYRVCISWRNKWVSKPRYKEYRSISK